MPARIVGLHESDRPLDENALRDGDGEDIVLMQAWPVPLQSMLLVQYGTRIA